MNGFIYKYEGGMMTYLVRTRHRRFLRERRSDDPDAHTKLAAASHYREGREGQQGGARTRTRQKVFFGNG
jgi:hypothetical protein